MIPSGKIARTCVVYWIAVSLTGCAMLGPAPPAPPVPGPTAAAPGMPGAPTIVAVAPAGPAPLTLPQFLGIDAAARGVVGGVRLVRLKLATRWPALQPQAAHPPLAVGDPANLQSPSPAVASAAAAQQAAAEAPAKAAALAYLASQGCANNAATEEALLAGLDDVVEDVRAAAAVALIKTQQRPGSLSCGCTASCYCNGCCTPAIRAKLQCLAYEQTESGCYCEPSPRVRRLCRLALEACGGSLEVISTPLEVPPAASLQAIQVGYTQPASPADTPP